MVGEALDVLRQGDGGLVSPTALLRQGLHHNPVEITLDQPAQPRRLDMPVCRQALQSLGGADPARWRRWFFLADHPEHLVQRCPLERVASDRRAAGQDLVKDDAECVDVGSGIDVEGVERRLLGGHVERGASDAAEGGEQRLFGELHPGGRLGEAEVDHLGDGLPVMTLDEDVRRLEVAVDDPFLVGVMHRRADLAKQVESLGEVQSVQHRSNRSAGFP